MTPGGILLYSDQSLNQSSSEKLHPAADGKKYRDPQPVNIEREGDFETLIPE